MKLILLILAMCAISASATPSMSDVYSKKLTECDTYVDLVNDGASIDLPVGKSLCWYANTFETVYTADAEHFHVNDIKRDAEGHMDIGGLEAMQSGFTTFVHLEGRNIRSTLQVHSIPKLNKDVK